MIALTLAYLVGLPISVWLLGAACAVIDEPQPIPALLKLVASVCLILIVLLLTDRALLVPLALALLTVIALHSLGFWLVRKRTVGVPVYQRTPPPPPLLEEEENPDAMRAEER